MRCAVRSASQGARSYTRVSSPPLLLRRFGADGAFERHLRLPYTLPEPHLQEAVPALACTYDAVAGESGLSRSVSVVASVLCLRW